MRYLRIDIPVREWQLVDATADNSVNIDVVDLEIESVIAGARVRDAGWRAAAELRGLEPRSDWPADDQVLAVTLHDEDWAWTVEQLDRWDDGNVLANAVRDRISRALN